MPYEFDISQFNEPAGSEVTREQFIALAVARGIPTLSH
jgi:hypothetical protein